MLSARCRMPIALLAVYLCASYVVYYTYYELLQPPSTGGRPYSVGCVPSHRLPLKPSPDQWWRLLATANATTNNANHKNRNNNNNNYNNNQTLEPRRVQACRSPVWQFHSRAVVILISSVADPGYVISAQKLARALHRHTVTPSRRHDWHVPIWSTSWTASSAHRITASQQHEADVQYDLIALHVLDRPIDRRSMRQLHVCGWQSCIVDRLTPQQADLGRYVDTFAKLYAWQLDMYDQVLLLDADMVIVEDIRDLLTRRLPLDRDLAAVRDYMQGHFVDTFNSGLMVLRPNASLFQDLRLAMNRPGIRHSFGEQGFLNQYFVGRWLELPVTDAANLDLYCRDWWQWKWHVEPRIRILHYTVGKPWDPDIRHWLIATARRWWFHERKLFSLI